MLALFVALFLFAPATAFADTFSFDSSTPITIEITGSGTVTLTSSDQPNSFVPIYINAGGGAYVDSYGKHWDEDRYFVGGQAHNRGDSVDILNTENDYIYQTERWGPAKYSVPVPNGTYDVQLHYAETYHDGAGRNTGAKVEGTVVQPKDTCVISGGPRRPVWRTAKKVVVSDGKLDIEMIGSSPTINAIEIAAAGTLPPDMPQPSSVDCAGGGGGGDDGGGNGGGGIGSSSECDPSDVPAEARSAGLTRLTFCEDFKDPKRISLGTDLGAGQTFTQVRGDNIFGAKPMPQSAFSFSDGAMHVRPTHNNYQVNFISTVPTGGGNFRGFALRGSGWYAQIRWRHDDCRKSSGFPAFWSMESRHLYGLTRRGELMLEPDFYENIGGNYIGALHQWDFHASPRHHVLQMTSQKMPQTPTQYFWAGAMSEKGATGYAWYFNGRRMDRKTPDWANMFNKFTGPIMFGSGPGCNYSVDTIRVWED